MKLFERNLYEITFDVKKSERDDKEYINCFIKTIKLHTRAPQQDQGEIVEF